MLTRILARLGLIATLVVTSVVAAATPAAAQEVTCSDDGYGGQICFVVLVVATDGGWTVEVEHQSGGEYNPGASARVPATT